MLMVAAVNVDHAEVCRQAPIRLHFELMPTPSIVKLLGLTGVACLGLAAGRAKPITLLERIYFAPVPQSVVGTGEKVPFPSAVTVTGLDPSDPCSLLAIGAALREDPAKL